MARINSHGTVNAKVTSQRDINDALYEFNALVQEAVLIESREFELTLTFHARQIKEGDEDGGLFTEGF